jgi:hypothetical protein
MGFWGKKSKKWENRSKVDLTTNANLFLDSLSHQ